MCLTPVPSLMEHEWAKHGTCMAPTPEAYFAREKALWRTLQWPDGDRLSRQRSLTVGLLRQAVALANPMFRPGQIGVEVGKGGWLREVRLCHSRRMTPIGCRAAQAGPPDSAPLKIWRGL